MLGFWGDGSPPAAAAEAADPQDQNDLSLTGRRRRHREERARQRRQRDRPSVEMVVPLPPGHPDEEVSEVSCDLPDGNGNGNGKGDGDGGRRRAKERGGLMDEEAKQLGGMGGGNWIQSVDDVREEQERRRRDRGGRAMVGGMGKKPGMMKKKKAAASGETEAWRELLPPGSGRGGALVAAEEAGDGTGRPAGRLLRRSSSHASDRSIEPELGDASPHRGRGRRRSKSPVGNRGTRRSRSPSPLSSMGLRTTGGWPVLARSFSFENGRGGGEGSKEGPGTAHVAAPSPALRAPPRGRSRSRHARSPSPPPPPPPPPPAPAPPGLASGLRRTLSLDRRRSRSPTRRFRSRSPTRRYRSRSRSPSPPPPDQVHWGWDRPEAEVELRGGTTTLEGRVRLLLDEVYGPVGHGRDRADRLLRRFEGRADILLGALEARARKKASLEKLGALREGLTAAAAAAAGDRFDVYDDDPRVAPDSIASSDLLGDEEKGGWFAFLLGRGGEGGSGGAEGTPDTSLNTSGGSGGGDDGVVYANPGLLPPATPFPDIDVGSDSGDSSPSETQSAHLRRVVAVERRVRREHSLAKSLTGTASSGGKELGPGTYPVPLVRVPSTTKAKGGRGGMGLGLGLGRSRSRSRDPPKARRVAVSHRPDAAEGGNVEVSSLCLGAPEAPAAASPPFEYRDPKRYDFTDRRAWIEPARSASPTSFGKGPGLLRRLSRSPSRSRSPSPSGRAADLPTSWDMTNLFMDGDHQ